jgi:hypothetical protein
MIIPTTKQYLRVPAKLRKEVLKKYKISGVALWKIVHLRINSKKAIEIRAYIEQNGGVWVLETVINQQEVEKSE